MKIENTIIVFLLSAMLAILPTSSQADPRHPSQETVTQKYNALHKAGLAAVQTRDYAGAEDYLRGAAETLPRLPWTWAELALILDYQGKTEEAFTTYQKAFGSPAGSTSGYTNDVRIIEALTRYGLMCEDRGQPEVAVQAYIKARQWGNSDAFDALDKTLDAKTTASPARIRTMLDLLRGVALSQSQQQKGQDRSAEAETAFENAAKRTPDNALAQLFLANGLREVGRYGEAETALQKVREMDKDGKLKVQTAISYSRLLAVPGYKRKL